MRLTSSTVSKLMVGSSAATKAYLGAVEVWSAGGYDADAQAYISAVEAADGEALETAVKDAYNAFIVGCKSDSIWTPIKSACILAGARTLTGALIPLVGTAPTNNNFVSGDYNRETGLVGDGSTKYINTNRLDSADPQNDHHAAVYVTQAGGGYYMAGNPLLNGIRAMQPQFPNWRFWSKSSVTTSSGGSTSTGLIGISRSTSGSFTSRFSGSDNTLTSSTIGNASQNVYVFARNGTSDVPAVFATPRLSFYSLGTNLDLAALDARLTALMSDIAAAIA